MKSQSKIKDYSWNLSLLYSSDNDPKILKDRQIADTQNQKFIKKWQKRTDYLTDPKALKQALDEYEKLQKNYGLDGSGYYYYHLRHDQDQLNTDIKAKLNQSEQHNVKLYSQIQFFELNLGTITTKNQKVMLNSPFLKSYYHFLERIFIQSKYQLSQKEEQILNLKSQTSYNNWVTLTSTFLAKVEKQILDAKGKKATKSFQEVLNLIRHKNKKIRDTAAIAFNQILLENVDIAEAEINSVLGHKQVNDELRDTPRPDFLRLIGDDISIEIVDKLIAAVTKYHYIAHRLYQLKAKLLKVPKLAYHERNVEIGKLKSEYSFEQAIDLITKVFTNLDPEFANIFTEFIKNGQVDVFPQKGKRNGAYCTSTRLSEPTYILLNHTNSLNDVLTIAHEFGHGIHNELSRVQNSLNFGVVMSTAEVASTFMEDFVLQEILQTANDEEKFSIMLQKLDSDISTIFRQIACYQFELSLHQAFRQKGYLSKQQIGTLFQKHMAEYMGKHVEQSPGSENWWVYWNHIRYYFYVYSYASGLLISKSLQSSVKHDKQFINKVKDFLSAGVSDSPENIFKQLGINIKDQSFWEQGLQEIETLLQETERLAKKLKKI